MSATHKSGCLSRLRKKRPIKKDKQTSTTFDTKICRPESSVQALSPSETNNVILRGTFSLENLPLPRARQAVDCACPTNQAVSITSNGMSHPSNVNDYIQAPYISSPDSSLPSEDVILLPSQSTPPIAEDVQGSQCVRDDGLVYPVSWRPMKSPPTHQSDSTALPHRCHCYASCVGANASSPVTSSCLSKPLLEKGQPQITPVRVEQTTQGSTVHPITSYKVMLFPSKHLESCHYHPAEKLRPASAGPYLVDVMGTAIPVHLRTDTQHVHGCPLPACRCHKFPSCHIHLTTERPHEPDYVTMTISPEHIDQQDTNEHHNSMPLTTITREPNVFSGLSQTRWVPK